MILCWSPMSQIRQIVDFGMKNDIFGVSPQEEI
jgi:hypothetical protein